MNFLRRLFKRTDSRITCPRCLGKGHVDMADIKRLDQELKWSPGACAYCNGSGKADADMESKVPVDATYLVNSLSIEEREKIKNNDSEAIQKARLYEHKMNDLIREIEHLHFNEKLSAAQIADHILLANQATGSNNRRYHRGSLIAYAKKVIESKKKDKNA